MSFLDKLRSRFRAPASSTSEQPTDAPAPQRVQLPPRPLRSVGSPLPSIWVDPDVPTPIGDQFGELARAATPGQAGIVVRSAASPHLTETFDASIWWWIGNLDDTALLKLRANPGEATLVRDETIRSHIERALPELIGDVWVATEQTPPVRSLISRYYPDRTESYVLGVIGYNLKFIRPILTNLVRNPGIEALIDEWNVFAARPTAITDQVIASSDIVLCEWCGPNAVYASHNKRGGQKLLVRLHRFELGTEHWRQIDQSQVDQFITVGETYRDLVLEKTGWDPDKVTVIGNQVDDLQLQRTKVPGSRFNIGMLGASSSRKRLDLAFDLIEKLHQHEPQFQLHVKTALPQDEKWVWDNEEERDYFDRELARLETDPLRDLVTFDGFGPDVANWFRKIGFILSVSDDESFHLAPAEGMASGTVPVVRNWPGADSVYSPSWVLATIDEMAYRILSTSTNEANWERAKRTARSEALDRFAMAKVVTDWANLLGRWSTDTLR